LGDDLSAWKGSSRWDWTELSRVREEVEAKGELESEVDALPREEAVRTR
jgi:hypothetical protein